METTKIIKATLKYLYKGVSKFDKTKTKKFILQTLFNIPIEYEGARYDTDDFIADFEEYIKDSEVTIKLRFKDGACYPQAIRFDKLGEKQDIFNPFEDFDDEDSLPFE